MRLFALILLPVGGLLAFLGAGLLLVALLNLGGRGPEVVLAVVGAVVLALGLGAVVWGIRILRRTKPLDHGASVAAGTAVGGYRADTPVTDQLDGDPYTVFFQSPTKGKNARPSELRVSTPVRTPCEVRVTTETWFDRTCKRVGLATEIETGDEAFDEECYVRSDTPVFAEVYLADPVRRAAIRDLRRMGFADVTLEGRAVTAKWVGFDPKAHDRPDLTRDVAARLLLLARDLPEHQPEFDYRTGRHRRKWQIGLWTFLVVFAATLLSLFAYRPISGLELVGRAAVVCLVGGPAFAYVSALALRGTSTSHYVWGGLMGGAMLLFPAGAVGTVTLVNGGADQSPAVTHKAVIVEKYTTKSKNRTNYHVRCASWRDPRETESFGVSQTEFNAVVANRSHMLVTTREGAMGIEWLVGKQLVVNPQ